MKHYDARRRRWMTSRFGPAVRARPGINAGLQDSHPDVRVLAPPWTFRRASRATGAGRYERLKTLRILRAHARRGTRAAIAARRTRTSNEGGKTATRSCARRWRRSASPPRRCDAAAAAPSTPPTRRRERRRSAALMNENVVAARDVRRRGTGGEEHPAWRRRPRAEFGAGSKFTGSGGAAVVLCPDGRPVGKSQRGVRGEGARRRRGRAHARRAPREHLGPFVLPQET